MKKISVLIILISVLFLSGCSLGSKEIKIEKPVSESNSISILDIQKKAEQDIKDATQKEQEKINKAMENAGLNDRSFVEKYSKAIIKTNMGNIEVEFFGKDSPITVNNFMKLASEGFYDGTKFHRVIKDFMIQGGDPNSKDDDWSNDGMGGPGYAFKDEFNSHELVRGSLAMANSGPNTNGSQFFIVTAEETPWLDGKHTNFGKITDGMDVVDKIEAMDANENDHPLKDAVIKGIELK
jgi:peptidyl-prolyl cis-trans isomerase B (cyclophilin B)